MGDRRVRWWRSGLVLALVAIMLVTAACGDDDDDDDANAGATNTTTAVTQATGADVTATTAPPPAATATTAAPATEAASPAADDSTEVPTGLEGDLIVFAAASLTDAFGAMQELLEEANPDLSIEFNFAGSQSLATQLTEGADADVFASANATQMTAAQDAERIDGEPVVFVRNRLVIIVPSDNPAGVQESADLAMDGLKLVVANPDVPVGGYTLDVLDTMSADPAFGADFRANVEANFVSLEENVKQVVTKVQLGEADVGVVYVSDVTPDVREDVLFIEIPEDFNIIAQYPVAPVTDGDAALAQAFIDYLLSESGQAVLEEWGFTRVEE